MEKLVLVQRQTLPWAEMTAARFKDESAQFCRMWGKRDDFVYDLMLLWNRTFELDYFQVRARLKSIAEQRQLNIPGVQFVPFEGYSNIPLGGAFYLFVDDDDWMSPDIAHYLLQEELLAYDGLVWPVASIGAPRGADAIRIQGRGGKCMTNNYAVNGQWLDSLRRLDEVRQHARANRTFRELTNKRVLPQLLGVTNKSPCSSVFLDRSLQGDFRPKKLATLLGKYIGKMQAIADEKIQDFSWARPQIVATRQLFEDVLDSRR